MIKETCEQVLSLFRAVEPNTNQSQGDITQLKSLPAIVLTGPRLEEVKSMRSQDWLTAIDTETRTFVKEKAPRWYNLVYNALVAAKTFRELADRLEGLSRLAQSAPLLTVEQQDAGRVRQYGWDWRTFPGNTGGPNSSGVYEAVGVLVVWDVEVYSGVTQTGSLITSIEITVASGQVGESGESGGVETTIVIPRTGE
ncbi:MAG: hypothetical protein LBC93_06890 [Synergistaceae bacterium]|nr:hypothetical protein [Synergistaceae bacterium]